MKRLLLFLAVALAGCLPRTQGELQNGGFTYFCAGEDDLACRNDLFDASGVPPAIAVGTHFDLQFSPPILHTDTITTVTSIEPAAPGILAEEPSHGVDTTGFRFIAPGTVAVLAKSADGDVVDFVHVTGAAIDHIALVNRQGNEPEAITLTGSGYTLEAIPRDDHFRTLAGALSYTWASSDEQVVTTSPSFESNEVALVAVGPGTATITVTVMGKQASIAVTVGGAP